MHKFKLLLTLFTAISCSQLPPSNHKYSRKQWVHWSDHDRDCLNTRNEILQNRSVIPPKLNKQGCKVVSGKWHDYYYPEIHFLPKKVDIDHLVPLKNAHDSGGSDWSREQKEKFANDPENLVITNLTYNRRKGSKGIDAWLPAKLEYACKYIKDWIKIKQKYNLEILPEEKNTIKTSVCK